MPLARFWLRRGDASAEVDSIKLMKFLTSAMLTWREGREAGTSEESPTLTTDVECLLLEALRTPGQMRMLVMEAISSCDGDLGNDPQRIALLLALVEASVGGADLAAVSAATKALRITPEHAGKLLQELLHERDVETLVSFSRNVPNFQGGVGTACDHGTYFKGSQGTRSCTRLQPPYVVLEEPVECRTGLVSKQLNIGGLLW